MTGVAPHQQVLDGAVARVNFFAQAIEVFGRDAARDIGETFLKSFAHAQETLPLSQPVSGIRLYLGEIGTGAVNGFAVSEQNTAYFAIDIDTPVEDIIEDIPDTVVHEFAHLAHAQQNPEMFNHKSKQSLFRATIVEGIACHAEYELHDWYSPFDVLDYDKEVRARLSNVLVDVLYDPDYVREMKYYDYLFGDDIFPDRGYVVGHYLVASTVARHGYTIEQLMKITTEEFKQIAETEL